MFFKALTFYFIFSFIAVNFVFSDTYYNYNTNNAYKGYWFYEKTPPKPKKEKIEPQPIASNQAKQTKPKLKNYYTEEEMIKMNVAELKAVMKHLLDQAVSNPSVENVKDYLMAVDVTRRKALAFTYTTMFVQQMYPQLSVLSAAPIAQPGLNSQNLQSNTSITKYIDDNSNDYALVLFVAKDCPYCKAMENIMKLFKNSSSMSLVTFYVTPDMPIVKKLNITGVPYLVVIKRGSDKWFPICQGVHDGMQIKHMLYYALRYLNNQITPQEWGVMQTEGSKMFNPNVLPQGLNQPPVENSISLPSQSGQQDMK